MDENLSKLTSLNVVITRLKKSIQTTESLLTSQHSSLAELIELRDELMDCKIIKPAAPTQTLHDRLITINNTAPSTGLMRRIVDEIVASFDEEYFTVREIFTVIVEIPNRNFRSSFSTIRNYLNTLVSQNKLIVNCNGTHAYKVIKF